MNKKINFANFLEKLDNNNFLNIDFDSYFESYNINMSIEKRQYNQIVKLFKQSEEISLNTFIWINASLAYGESTNGIKNKIKIYIEKYKEIIFKELEKTPSLNNFINNKNKQYYNAMIYGNISFEYILDINTLNVYHHSIYKENRLWGVEYLLINLFKYVKKDFNNWFTNTKREDLKLIFSESILSPIFHNRLLTIEDDNSDILFIRILSKIEFYNINVNHLSSDKSFLNLEKNEENALLVLYHFYRKNLKVEDKLYLDKLKQDISNSKEFLSILSEKEFKNCFEYINHEILYELIYLMEDRSNKEKVFMTYSDYLERKVVGERYISSISIDLSNTFGNVLFQLDKKYFLDFKEKTKKLLEEINEPFYFYRFWNEWNLKISHSCLFLITIYIYCKLQNKNDYLEIKEKFLKCKENFEHNSDEKIEFILNQII